MFGFDEKTLMKMARAYGAKVKFDGESRQIIVTLDGQETTKSFDEIEKMINGD